MNGKIFCNCILVFCLFAGIDAICQVDFPDPSPRQTVTQDFGMSSITLSYSRPGVKGRKMIGNTEPYGSVWRAGANRPTTVRFRSPVSIGNQLIDSGTYVIYLIPRMDSDWTFILNRGVKNWGSDNYKSSDDTLRTSVRVQTGRSAIESLSYHFENVKAESVDLVVEWETWRFTVAIAANIKEKLRSQIEANLKTEKPIYWFAAQFYYEYDNNFPKALEMITAAIKRNETSGLKPYWQYHYKARILKDLGRKEEAIEAATRSAQMAKEHGNRNNYVTLNQELINSLK